MKKEFVSYEQAVSLKELLYGEHYGDDYIAWYSSNKDFHYRNMKSPVYPNNQSYIAPLKQQVFRWFRDKYFLDSEIYLQEEQGHKFYHYLVLQLVRGNIEWKTRNITKFKTYEEAENACIDKLIELTKQQNNA